MYKMSKSVIILLVGSRFLMGCSEECNSQSFSSYCDGNTLVYCAYDGGIENASEETVIYEDCSKRNADSPFCVEAPNENNLFLRANCVISKTKDPNCSLEDARGSYCMDTAKHDCYYGYTSYVSGKGMCSE